MSETPRRGIILLADDDPNDLFLTRRLIGKAGLKNTVKTFCDGEELIAFLRLLADDPSRQAEEGPCLLFLDLKMPRLDGFEVLRWVRKQPLFSGLPVVVLSGSEEPRDISKASSLGATAYLTKHPAPEEVARIFSRHVLRI